MFEPRRRAAPAVGFVADDFVYDDPINGRFTKAEFASYLERVFGGGGEGTADTDADDEYETISDVVIQKKDGEETTWAWWKTASEEGSEVVKSGPDGVHLDKLAYCTGSPRPVLSWHHSSTRPTASKWCSPDARGVLERVWRALRPGGLVVVRATIADEERRAAEDALLAAVDLLLWLPTSCVYTFSEYQDLLQRAGFVEIKRRGEEIVTAVRPS